ncbi:hypothetical protein ASPFODRAFT_652843 [Aspergillus luchuensis CBS 106.47]|uniref:Uncharacterized protein n=1 Tax=Aspergillus luchuensis (strain CBS 106.47) TaxID=1137211 RepID=A0A1M3TEC2_ASPLC|nr:hypothetical protein ASPFODRAFT_652843 [Aspergillus luchuensis CBS 106.47]
MWIEPPLWHHPTHMSSPQIVRRPHRPRVEVKVEKVTGPLSPTFPLPPLILGRPLADLAAYQGSERGELPCL